MRSIRGLYGSNKRLVRFNQELCKENHYLREELKRLALKLEELGIQVDSLRRHSLVDPSEVVIGCEGLACSEWDVCNNCSSIDD